jgi:hypothetical protein
MFAQGDVSFAEAPNVINPRIVFEFMSARPGRHLARARCPVLLVAAKADDNLPFRIATEIAQQAKDSSFALRILRFSFNIAATFSGYIGGGSRRSF